MVIRRAVIDIGTVTTRLMVADCDIDGDGVSVDEVFRTMEITELGVGLLETGILSAEGIGRVASAVDSFVVKMGELGMDLSANDSGNPFVIAMATSAARDASNSQDLVDALALRNIPLAVISGDKEASLSFSGAVADFRGHNILVNDIGGGSTELVLGDAPEGRVAPTITKGHSFNVGCRRVTDMFLHSDPPTESELAQAREWTQDQLSAFFEEGMVVEKLVGVAGTVTSLVSMHDEMREYDPALVHGRTMHLADVDFALERLSKMTVEERRHVVGLEPKRAPLIVAGMLILQILMQLAGTDELVVSESDNLLGLMLNWP